MGNSGRNLMGQGTFETESERGIRFNKLRNSGASSINPEEQLGQRGVGAPEISPMSTIINMQPSKSLYEPDRTMTPSSVTRFMQTPF